MPPLPPHCRFGHRCLWEGLEPVPLDTHRILGLFLHRHPGTPTHTQSSGRRREVTVLPLKRSNAINIALTALPSPTLLHAALLSPHPLLNPLSSPLTPQPGLLDRDTIQRVRALVPSVEELGAIEEAQRAQAHLPLGPAEHFLRTLGSVPQLGARLALGSFMHEYASREREIAESLFDLKLGMEQLAGNKTFHCILATLLAIGNFLNGMNAGGFELSYLGRVGSVRDTVEKKPLLYHTCAMVMETFPHAGDLYTQILALTRCTQVDLQHLGAELSQLEWGCREAWDHLHTIARSSSAASRSPTATFLREAAQRIIILKDVHRRVRNRFHAFLLYLGYPNPSVRTATVSGFCKMVRDFALEYRMVRIQILQQRERQRERERQRAEGAPWEGETDSPRIRSLYPERSRKHEDMEEVLRTPERSRRFDSSLPRTKRSQGKDTPQQKTFTW